MTDVAAACAEVQAMLVAGELPAELAPHVDGCDECRFFASLSRALGGDGASGSASIGPVGGPLDEIVERALRSGEPLLGRYRLERELGSGGQGRVLAATDLESGDSVAVKLVRARGSGPVLEVANARRVRHPHVCRVFHAERHGDLRLIVMEIVEGPTLAERSSGLRRADALLVFSAVCDGVAAAHAAGVLHLDLKQQNVLLRDRVDPVVTDFGLSVAVGDEAARARGGTVAYMAPEQRRGDPVDARTDVFALGVMLRELLGTAQLGLGGVIAKATAADPALRFADAAALARAVRARLGWRRTVMRAALVLSLVPAIALAVAYLLPLPAGRRAAWDASRWGPDYVPASAWNVAAQRGSWAPRIETSHPGFACGQSVGELVDLLTGYADWKHGFAFPPPPPGNCVGLDLLGTCGQRRDDAALCVRGDDGTPRLLGRTAGEAATFPPEERARLGQWTEGIACGERSVTVDLDALRPVRAVRTWHHGPEHVPRRYRIEVEDAGAWRVVYRTTDNVTAHAAWRTLDDGGYGSGPCTADFPPVTTRRVRFAMDTCSAEDPARTHGWLYEIEVLADVPWHEAWRRWLLDRR